MRRFLIFLAVISLLPAIAQAEIEAARDLMEEGKFVEAHEAL